MTRARFARDYFDFFFGAVVYHELVLQTGYPFFLRDRCVACVCMYVCVGRFFLFFSLLVQQGGDGWMGDHPHLSPIFHYIPKYSFSSGMKCIWCHWINTFFIFLAPRFITPSRAFFSDFAFFCVFVSNSSAVNDLINNARRANSNNLSLQAMTNYLLWFDFFIIIFIQQYYCCRDTTQYVVQYYSQTSHDVVLYF